MAARSLALQIAEFAEIIRQFRRLRHYVKALLPREVALAEARFEELFPEDRSHSAGDADLLYSMGVTLSHREEPITMGELSQSLDVPLSTATRIVDLLVKHEYVRRLPDSNDRRVVRVALTDTGQAMYQIVDDFIRERVERVLRHFTAEEREALIHLMRKLVKALEQEAQYL